MQIVQIHSKFLDKSINSLPNSPLSMAVYVRELIAHTFWYRLTSARALSLHRRPTTGQTELAELTVRSDVKAAGRVSRVSSRRRLFVEKHNIEFRFAPVWAFVNIVVLKVGYFSMEFWGKLFWKSVEKGKTIVSFMKSCDTLPSLSKHWNKCVRQCCLLDRTLLRTFLTDFALKLWIKSSLRGSIPPTGVRAYVCVCACTGI